MTESEPKFPINNEGRLEPVGAEYVKEHWQECWADIVLVRNKLPEFVDDPNAGEGAKALIKAIDILIEQNAQLRIPVQDVLDMAEFLGFGNQEWPVWYQHMSGLKGGGKFEILVSRGAVNH